MSATDRALAAPPRTMRVPEAVLAVLGAAALVLVAFLAPWLKFVLTVALAKGIAVLGILLLLRAGQVSFGHSMFLAVGAYTVAFIAPAMPEALLLLPLGALLAGLLGLVIGLFVVRYRDIFFGMLNLALAWCSIRCWKSSTPSPRAPTASASPA